MDRLLPCTADAQPSDLPVRQKRVDIFGSTFPEQLHTQTAENTIGPLAISWGTYDMKQNNIYATEMLIKMH